MNSRIFVRMILLGLLLGPPVAFANATFCQLDFAPGTPGFETALDSGIWLCADSGTGSGGMGGWAPVVSQVDSAGADTVSLHVTLDVSGSFGGTGAGDGLLRIDRADGSLSNVATIFLTRFSPSRFLETDLSSFAVGDEVMIWMTLRASAGSSHQIGGPLLSTAEINDDAGQVFLDVLSADAVFVSTRGQDYRSVPEPLVVWSLAAGVVALVMSTQARRRRRCVGARRARMNRAAPLGRAFGVLVLMLALPVSGAFAQAIVSASPDITITLGGGNLVTSDHSVAVDNQLGIVALENLGAIPLSADVTGYADGGAGTFLFSLDTTVSFANGVVANPNDVVAWNGATHSIRFDGLMQGIPSGVRIDAISIAAGGGLVLSFDTDVSLPGGFSAADEDLVKFSGGVFTIVLDGSAVGIDRSLDIDGAQDIGGGYLVSFDTAGTVGGVTFQDEDILRRVGGTWTLAFDASNADPDWGAADLDALQVPEPNVLAMLVAGIVGLVGLVGLVGMSGRRVGRTLVCGASLLMLGFAFVAPALASDGVIEINHVIALAGGVNGDLALDPPGYPVTITQSGSYLLTSHMNLPDADTSGVVVTALRTTIDFGGFEIRGPNQRPTKDTPCTAPGLGVGVSSDSSVIVRDGRISGMGLHGLSLGPNSRVERMMLTQNCGVGLFAGDASIVLDTEVTLSSDGIFLGASSRVRDSVANQNYLDGIIAGVNSLVSSCVATNNYGDGIRVGPGSVVIQNVSASNGTGVTTFPGGSTVLHNSIRSNVNGAMRSFQSDGIGGNTLNLNGAGGGISAGVALGCNAINGVASCP